MLLKETSLWAVAVMKWSYLTMNANLKNNAAKGCYHNVSAWPEVQCSETYTIEFWWCPLPFTRHKIQIFTTEAIQLLAQTNKYCAQKQWPKSWVLITVWCKQTGDHPHIFPSIRLCFRQHAISTNTFHLRIFTTVYTSAIRHTVTSLCLWYAALSDTSEKN